MMAMPAAHDSVPCCLASMRTASALQIPRAALDDVEGTRVPEGLPALVDAHVHVFPDRLFDAVWRWFDQHGWPIRYRLYADAVIAHLRARGVAHQVLLHYAHKPGIARAMNAFVAELTTRHAGVTGLATVYPGEPGQVEILSDAFAAGLRGVKLHCHVQGLAADDASVADVYSLCQQRGVPVVIHAGREPTSDALPVDPYTICDVSRVAWVLKEFPKLKLCVPHLGADEFDSYAELMCRHDTLWLDTTMMLASYFDIPDVMKFVRARPQRVVFGTDFPNLPYAWDREARALANSALPRDALQAICADSARELFALPAMASDVVIGDR